MFTNTECPVCGEEIDPAYRREAKQAVEELADEFRNDSLMRKIQDKVVSASEWASMVPTVPNAKPIYEYIRNSNDDRLTVQKMTNSPEEAAMYALHQRGRFSFTMTGTTYELKCQKHS